MAHLYDYNVALIGGSSAEVNTSWEATTIFTLARIMAAFQIIQANIMLKLQGGLFFS